MHERGPRRERPLIKVNCASIPASCSRASSFGHIRGLFTGAVRDRVGRPARRPRHAVPGRGRRDPARAAGVPLRVLQEGSSSASARTTPAASRCASSPPPTAT
ncbi:MAG: sigma 54-interacting transcriptional regulator [bacterium]|nr:sigma 54-interacting transcriptional regulator [bacterium]